MLWALELLAVLLEVVLAAVSIAVYRHQSVPAVAVTAAASLALASVSGGVLCFKMCHRTNHPTSIILQLVAFGLFVGSGIATQSQVAAHRVTVFEYPTVLATLFTLVVIIVSYAALPGYHFEAPPPPSATDLEKKASERTLVSEQTMEKHLPSSAACERIFTHDINDIEAQVLDFDNYCFNADNLDYNHYNGLFDSGIPETAHLTPPTGSPPSSTVASSPNKFLLAASPITPHNWSLPTAGPLVTSPGSPLARRDRSNGSSDPSSAASHSPIRRMLSTTKHHHSNSVSTLRSFIKSSHHKKSRSVPTAPSYTSFTSQPSFKLPQLPPQAHLHVHEANLQASEKLAKQTVAFPQPQDLWEDYECQVSSPALSEYSMVNESRISSVPSQVIGQYDREKWRTLQALRDRELRRSSSAKFVSHEKRNSQ
ncbi:hypothetical protein DICA1_E15236 [Diutina catenulata]